MSRYHQRLRALEVCSGRTDLDDQQRLCELLLDECLVPMLEYRAMSDAERRRAVDEMADAILARDDTPEDRSAICAALHQMYAPWPPLASTA